MSGAAARPAVSAAADAVPQILCVDDEPNVLDGLVRVLGEAYDVTCATSGAEALAELARGVRFAAVVSDMRMPIMDGATFLAQARDLAPEVTRILLTGQTDLHAAIAAVNRGNVFRFLLKPCPADALDAALADAVAQHRLVIAQRELLEHTLVAAIEMLTDVLGLTSPVVFSRCVAMRGYVRHLIARLRPDDAWELELAALLSQLGLVTVSAEALGRVLAGQDVAEADRAALAGHAEVAARLIAAIPRLERVARMVRAHAEPAPPGAADDAEARGAAMLRLARDVDELRRRGLPLADALDRLVHRHPPRLLAALRDYHGGEDAEVVRSLKIRELSCAMVLEDDVLAHNGMVVVPRGQAVTPVMLERLARFAGGQGLVEPVRVRITAGAT